MQRIPVTFLALQEGRRAHSSHHHDVMSPSPFFLMTAACQWYFRTLQVLGIALVQVVEAGVCCSESNPELTYNASGAALTPCMHVTKNPSHVNNKKR